MTHALQALRHGAVTAVALAVVCAALALREHRYIPPGPPVAAVPVAYPLRVVRVTEEDILYQGQVIASLSPRSLCEDGPCFKIDSLFELLLTASTVDHYPPPLPPETIDLGRMVIVELDPLAESGLERKVLYTIAAAGYEPVVRYAPDPYSLLAR